MRSSMHTSLAILTLATGCGAGGQPALEAMPAASPQAPEPRPPWDPAASVEPEDYATTHLFVVAERAAICPSVEEALGDGCGHSSEWVDGGYWAWRGETVLVVDEPAHDGVHRAFRYLSPGIFPGWVRADALAPRPRLDEAGQRYFAAAADRGAVIALDAEALRAAPLGDPIVLRNVPAEALAYAEGPPDDLTLTLSLAGEVAAELHAALALPARRLDYGNLHPSLVYGNGTDLVYGDAPGYEDRITMELVRVEGATPTFEVRALLDRFGLFTEIPDEEAP